jgi:hypothetical protein
MTATVAREPFSFDKLRRWLLMKAQQIWRRRMYLRKARVYAVRPATYLRRARIAQIQALSAVEQAYLSSLRRVGWVLTPGLSDPVLAAEVAMTVTERVAAGRGMSIASTAKSFWQPVLVEADLKSSSTIVRFALQDSVVRLATAYLGQAPFLARIELVISRATADGDWKSSQRWHRDHNDRRLFKLFTYFSDVESVEDGPFTLIPGDICARLRDPLFPVHKTDAMMDRLGGTASKYQIYGPRLTTFAVDTARCYHCGSRIVGQRYRVMMILTFTTFATYQPYDNGITIDSDVTPLQRLILRN